MSCRWLPRLMTWYMAPAYGFCCRRTKPFPFYIYYEVIEETIYFLGLVHVRRHPAYLKKRIEEEGKF